MSGLLEVEGVGFGYGGGEILRSISLQAEAGEFVAVLGANGQGKSTLLDLLSGFRTPAAGMIRIGGRELRDWAPREFAHQVSHLPQAVGADLPFTAGQLVGMGRYPHTDRWFESDEDQRAIAAAMDRTGCGAWRDRVFGTLSGGERQRVLLASCLAQGASILLLDEPSTYLDIEQQLLCFSLLREEADAGRLCLAVTHDLNLALRFCTRLVVLADGVVARDLPVGQAGESAEWLGLFSPRLRLGQTDAGEPWVWYR